jgi:chemotaxis protein histidine kinase CheA
MTETNDSAYLQQWRGIEGVQADDLQEILFQFDCSAYLKDSNLFGSKSSALDPRTPTNFDGLKDAKKRKGLTVEDFSGKRQKKGIESFGEADLQKVDQVNKSQEETEPSNELAKRRENHNATERRRREKINEQIDELRKLLPGGGKGVNKTAVLHQTAERLRTYQSLFNRLLQDKKRLEKSKEELLEEVYRLRSSLSHPPMNEFPHHVNYMNNPHPPPIARAPTNPLPHMGYFDPLEFEAQDIPESYLQSLQAQ